MLTAGLLRELDPLLAELRRDIPRAGRDFHPGEEHQVARERGIGSSAGVDDQRRPEGTRFLVPVGAGEQPCERRARVLVVSDRYQEAGATRARGSPRSIVVADAKPELDRPVEQVAPDAPGAPERHLGQCREGRSRAAPGRPPARRAASPASA